MAVFYIVRVEPHIRPRREDLTVQARIDILPLPQTEADARDQEVLYTWRNIPFSMVGVTCVRIGTAEGGEGRGRLSELSDRRQYSIILSQVGRGFNLDVASLRGFGYRTPPGVPQHGEGSIDISSDYRMRGEVNWYVNSAPPDLPPGPRR